MSIFGSELSFRFQKIFLGEEKLCEPTELKLETNNKTILTKRGAFVLKIRDKFIEIRPQQRYLIDFCPLYGFVGNIKNDGKTHYVCGKLKMFPAGRWFFIAWYILLFFGFICSSLLFIYFLSVFLFIGDKTNDNKVFSSGILTIGAMIIILMGRLLIDFMKALSSGYTRRLLEFLKYGE